MAETLIYGRFDLFNLREDDPFYWRLDSGLRVYLRRQPAGRIVHLGLFIHHGSQNEDEQTNGIAHFIEHVLFTPKHFTGTAARLFSHLEAQGASYDAFTSKEYTRISLKCLPDAFNAAMGCLSSLVVSRTLHPNAIEEERPIILQEHAMTFAASLSMDKQVLDNAMWGDHSIGLHLLGRKENIKRFTFEEIEARIQTYFTPERVVLVIVGPLDVPSLIEAVDTNWKHWSRTTADVPMPAATPVASAIAMPTQSKRITLHLGYLGVPFGSSERCEMEILSDILGGGIRSRLFRELREIRKLVYHVQSITVSYGIGGHIAIAVNCDRNELEECYSSIKRVIDSVKKHGVTTAELNRVKADRIMSLLDTAETPSQYLHLLGRRALLHEPFEMAAEIARIRRVDCRKLIEFARRILVDENLGAAGFGLHQQEMSKLFD